MGEPDEQGFTVRPIGVVRGGRDEPVDDDWGQVTSTIALLPPYDARALQGLEGFSHVEVVYLFHRVDPATVHTGVRRPRGNGAWPEVGIFAQRAKDRPNRIGVSTCELLAVRPDGIEVRGLDAIDGTPVLDLKPYMAEFAPRQAVHQPAWSHELMARYY
ncbi:MAG TPA: tRNA (N6-threonylcarbamoyladenosine(37)-N6)-methyltransferase TrmO [Acidimicrobiales bacterium]|nr:tRNA (N6-threonylcarbamoyladenosine(37)-N6)-methyltransferase TrmO [Acidimicrobiales bacterium]